MKISYKYEIKDKEKNNPEQIVSLILKQRKIKSIKDFLNPKLPSKINLSDFGYKKEINKTIKILKEIKKNKQTIVVYTDYDADGITGGAILWETLYLLGFKTMPYVPHRKHEGYGFSIKGIDNIKKQFNPALIISVDHGITKVKEVDYAKKLGIKIIITDHHLKQEKIPKAEAIFHIPELSGSGVSYFFSKMIFDHFRSLTTNYSLLTTNFLTDYLSLASIGTIADLVPLVGPSRSIVKYGLEAFPNVKRYGLKHILRDAGLEGKKITPYEVGFMLAPRINAVGRLKHAIDALRLLCTTDESRAKKLAEHLGKTNRLRQDELEKSLEEAEQIINNSQLVNSLTKKLIILVSEKWHEGIIGLIASKLTEKYYRSTIILTKVNGVYKGSARSIPNFHITNFLRELKKYLIDVGGHTQAAGFTLEEKQLSHFVTAVTKWSQKKIKDKDLERKTEVDIKIPLSKINLSLASELEKLQPFGIGNPQPTFLSSGELTGAQTFGKSNNHLKLFFKDPNQITINKYQLTIEFISFNSAYQLPNLSRGQTIDIVYKLNIDRWNGQERLRGIIQNIDLS